MYLNSVCVVNVKFTCNCHFIYFSKILSLYYCFINFGEYLLLLFAFVFYGYIVIEFNGIQLQV